MWLTSCFPMLTLHCMPFFQAGIACAATVFSGLQASHAQCLMQLHVMLSDRVAMAKAAKA